jgi:YfhD-like protein
LKGVFEMNRNQANSTEVTYHDSSLQVFNQIQSDGIDEEFSEELADHADKEAQARAKAANQRAKNK